LWRQKKPLLLKSQSGRGKLHQSPPQLKRRALQQMPRRLKTPNLNLLKTPGVAGGSVLLANDS
jgi:hypothetical protein